MIIRSFFSCRRKLRSLEESTVYRMVHWMIIILNWSVVKVTHEEVFYWFGLLVLGSAAL